MQQYRKSQRPCLDILTWIKCFSLYIAVMSRRYAEMIPSMVAHMHTVLKLNQKAPKSMSWYEYDMQFRMEMAASEDRTWTDGDPWQYITCLPGPSRALDAFDMAEEVAPVEQESFPNIGPDPTRHLSAPAQPVGPVKRRKAVEDAGRGAAKCTKRPGACRLFNKAPGGCPYGKECIFTHYCSNCGAPNEHSRMACPFPPRFLPGPSHQQLPMDKF